MKLSRLASCALLLSGCSGSAAAPPVATETLTCPAPIGPVPKEDCARVAGEFAPLDVSAVSAQAGSGKDAARRREAIDVMAQVGRSIRDERVKLCEDYVKCKVPLDEHDARDRRLAQAMTRLAELWNRRSFGHADQVIRMVEAARALDRDMNADEATASLAAPQSLKADLAFTRAEGNGLTFGGGSGSVTVSSASDGDHDALVSKASAVNLVPGHRYHFTLTGSFTLKAAPLIRPGDELTARLRYHATGDTHLAVALRSLDDPDASEASEAFDIASGDKGVRETKLTADPRQSGFSLGLAVSRAPIQVESFELLRGGQVLAAAKLGDPATRTTCEALPNGASGFSCSPAKADVITLARPTAYLTVRVDDNIGSRASVKTQSLEGGRSVDAAVSEGARITVALTGAGAATLDQIEITDLGLE